MNSEVLYTGRNIPLAKFEEASLADLVGIAFPGEGQHGEREMDCYVMVWPHRERVLHRVAVAQAAAGDVIFTTAKINGCEQQHVGFVLPGLRVLQARRHGRSHHVAWPMMARFIRDVYRVDGRVLRALQGETP